MPKAADPRTALRRAADPRVVGGVLIMMVSAYLGLVVVGQDEPRVLVAVAAHDLPAGLDLQPDDVTLREVVIDEPDRYVTEAQPVGSLQTAVGQGELLPRSAVASQRSDVRQVAVAVDAERLPPGLGRGSLVDVWASGDQPVLERVAVVSVADPQRWAGATASLVLAVPPGDVPQLLAATREATVDVTVYQGAS